MLILKSILIENLYEHELNTDIILILVDIEITELDEQDPTIEADIIIV